MQPSKYPRTLNEAFGPYTSHDFEEPAHPRDVLACVACAFAAIGLVIVLIVWG